ncbi:hypothetical protein J2127_000509 [Methanococcus voltae]|nr:hypothetical protein [Methanococcus voltae]
MGKTIYEVLGVAVVLFAFYHIIVALHNAGLILN